MAQAQVVYTGPTDGSVATGTLFKGMKFWIAQRCPMRSSFVDQVKSNGGDVVSLEKHADILIVDHARKDIAPGTHSYTFIEQSIRKGALEDLDDHIAGPPAGSIRPVGSVRPTKGGRVAFTAEDDRALREWVRGYQRKGGKVLGNEIYKQLEAVNNRHTWQSWRDRYVKYLSQSEPQLQLPDNGPPTLPLDMPARLPRKPSPAPTKTGKDPKQMHPVDGGDDELEHADTEGGSAEPLKEVIMRKVIAAGIRSKTPWTQTDFDDLFIGAPNIEATPVREYRRAWVKWGRAWRTHTIKEWREFYEKIVYPIYRKSLKENQVSQSQNEEDRESSSPSGKEDTGCMRKSTVGAEPKDQVSPGEITTPKANPLGLESADATLRRSPIVLIPTSGYGTVDGGPSEHGGKRSPTSALLNSASPTKKRVRMDEPVTRLIEESPSPQPSKRRRTDDSHVGSPSLSDKQEAETAPGRTAAIGGRTSEADLLALKVTFDDDLRHDGSEQEVAEHEPPRTKSPLTSTSRLGRAALKNSDLRFREASPMVEGVEILDEMVGDLEEEIAASNVQKSDFSKTSSIEEVILDIINMNDAGMPDEADARREANFRMSEADDDWHELSSSVEDFQSAPEKLSEALSCSAQQLQDELEQPLSKDRQPTVESETSREEAISSATQYVGRPQPSPAKPTEHFKSPPSKDYLGGSSPVRSALSSTPAAAVATKVETQTLSGLETQDLDFDVPEPDGGFGELEDEDVLGMEEREQEKVAEDGKKKIYAGQDDNKDGQDQAAYSRGEESGQQEVVEEEWEGIHHETRQEQEEEEEDVLGIEEGEREERAEHMKEEIFIGQTESQDQQDEALYLKGEEGGQQEMLEEECVGIQHEPRVEHVVEERGEDEESDTHYDPPVASRDHRHDGSTSPGAAASTHDPNSITQQDLDTWISLQCSSGYTEEEVADAVLRTCLQLELAEQVLVAVRNTGCIPRGMKGVWTDRDDEVLEEADSRRPRTLTDDSMVRGRMRRLEEKHGEEEIQRRRAHWRTRRNAEQVNVSGSDSAGRDSSFG